MKPETKRRLRTFAITTVIPLAVIGYALLLWRGPWWLDGGHLRDRDLQPADGVIVTGVRTALVALGAGIVAGIGIWYTHKSHRHAEKLYQHSQEQFEHARKKDSEQAELTREGQVTERYVAAIKLLGSENLTERLGGIYSLERIMRDSVKDHSTVVKVLAAFLCSEAALPAKKHQGDPREDISAALAVLVRRPNIDGEEPIRLKRTFLSGQDLTGVQLPGANLINAYFVKSLLQGANLTGAGLMGACLKRARLEGAQLVEAYLERADLRGAELTEANLANASLQEADLSGAGLIEANLHGANLTKAKLAAARLDVADLTRAVLADADLTGATLSHATVKGAKLKGAVLRGADLSETQDLTLDQILGAQVDGETSLSVEFSNDMRIHEHIEECESREEVRVRGEQSQIRSGRRIRRD